MSLVNVFLDKRYAQTHQVFFGVLRHGLLNCVGLFGTAYAVDG